MAWLKKLGGDRDPVQVGLDCALDAPLGDFLTWVWRYKGKIVGFQADGPAGGNPYVVIQYPMLVDWEDARDDPFNGGDDSDKNTTEVGPTIGLLEDDEMTVVNRT